MVGSLNLLGVPSSAGAYAPGQELAPSALRNAGLVKELETRGFSVNDLGDVPTARWQVDKDHPDAMNAGLSVVVPLLIMFFALSLERVESRLCERPRPEQAEESDSRGRCPSHCFIQ